MLDHFNRILLLATLWAIHLCNFLLTVLSAPCVWSIPILLKNIQKAEPVEVRQESTSSQGSPSPALWIWRNNHLFSLASFSQDIRRPKGQLLSFTGMAKLELLTSLLPSLSGPRARSGFTECLACQASSWCRGCFCELNRCMHCPAELKVHLVVETGSEQTSLSLPRSARKQTDRNKKVV